MDEREGCRKCVRRSKRGHNCTKKNKIPGGKCNQRGKGGFVDYWFSFQVRQQLEQRSDTSQIPVQQDPSGWCVESHVQPAESREVGAGGKGKGQETGLEAATVSLQPQLLCPSLIPSILGIRTPGCSPSSISH